MKKEKIINNIFSVVGVVAGIIAIILGIVVANSGDYADTASFGGDFYTYSYKATRYSANNILEVIKALGYLLISFGLFDISYFGNKCVALLPIGLRERKPNDIVADTPIVEQVIVEEQTIEENTENEKTQE